MDGVGQLLQLRGQLADPAADDLDGGVLLDAPPLGGLAVGGGQGQGQLQVAHGLLEAVRDSHRDLGLVGEAFGPDRGALPRLALLLGVAVQRVGAAGQGSGPLLGGPHRQPGFHLRRACGGALTSERVAPRGRERVVLLDED